MIYNIIKLFHLLGTILIGYTLSMTAVEICAAHENYPGIPIETHRNILALHGPYGTGKQFKESDPHKIMTTLSDVLYNPNLKTRKASKSPDGLPRYKKRETVFFEGGRQKVEVTFQYGRIAPDGSYEPYFHMVNAAPKRAKTYYGGLFLEGLFDVLTDIWIVH